MTPQEFADKMRYIEQIEGSDKEAALGSADDLMCELLRELGYDEGVDIFEQMDKWYA